MLAPVAGTVVALADVPDPVFAGALVGPGVAIDPAGEPVAMAALSTAVAPVDGVLASLHPHAYAVRCAADGADPGGRAVLVHLGIDTVQLRGAGFSPLREVGAVLRAGDHVTSWDVAGVRASGRSVVCPVIALGADPADIELLVTPGSRVRAGAPLWRWAPRPGA